MAQLGISIPTPTELDEYVFHIVKIYTMLKTSIALKSAIFENDSEVCAKIESDFVEGGIADDSFQKGGKKMEIALREDSPLWRDMTIDAMRLELRNLMGIVRERGGRLVELESVARKLPQLFREWSSKGPLSPSAVRQKYFINPVIATRGSRLMREAISSESAEEGAGAAKSIVATPQAAQAPRSATLCEWLCCCSSQPKSRELDVSSPLVPGSKG